MRWIWCAAVVLTGILTACAGSEPAGPCGGETRTAECGTRCHQDTDCTSGFFCDVAQCTAQCGPVDDCPHDDYCDPNGRCIQPEEGGGEPTCVVEVITAEPLVPMVSLVMSPSMAGWENIVEELVDADDGPFATHGSRIAFGVATYSGDNSGLCPVVGHVAPALDNYEPIAGLFRNTRKSPASPAAAAVRTVMGGFSPVDPRHPAPRIIVLVTDGRPTDCTGSMARGRRQLGAAVARAHAADIDVVVVGGGANPDMEFIGELRQAAGRVAIASPRSAGPLGSSLGEILRAAQSCDFVLSAGVDPSAAQGGVIRLQVGETSMSIPAGKDWEITDATTLRLSGAACEMVRAGEQVGVRAELPCGSRQQAVSPTSESTPHR